MTNMPMKCMYNYVHVHVHTCMYVHGLSSIHHTDMQREMDCYNYYTCMYHVQNVRNGKGIRQRMYCTKLYLPSGMQKTTFLHEQSKMTQNERERRWSLSLIYCSDLSIMYIIYSYVCQFRLKYIVPQVYIYTMCQVFIHCACTCML